MATTLNFGVIDQPYAFPAPVAKAKKGKRKSGKRKARKGTMVQSITTGAVAEILEEKYGVMEFFFDHNEKQIMGAMQEGLQGAFESLLMGSPVSHEPFAAGCSEVEDLFKRFHESKQMDGAEGVPTQASLDGTSHRFKGKKGTPGRPSFIDTGLYENSFKCWVD